MKKKLNILFALLLSGTMLTACSGQKQEKEDSMKDIVTVTVSCDGLGHIAVSDDGKQPEIEGSLFTSTVMNVDEGTELILTCKAEDDWKFARWTKDGSNFSEEQTITVSADANTEFVAVFMLDSGYEGEAVTDIKDVKTLGDVLALPSHGDAYGMNNYVYAFDLNGITYQVIAPLDAKTAEALNNLEITDPDYDKKVNTLIAPLAVSEIINITEEIPSESQLQSYVGKTFGELFDEGWECRGWNLDEKTVYLDHSYFSFEAGFDKEITSDSMDEETLAKMTVTSMSYNGIGDAADYDNY